MRVTWLVVGFALTACGGRTGLEVPGDACLADSADCDGDPSNGCEADLTTAAAHCGACGESCPDGLFCAAGGCVPGNRVVLKTNGDLDCIGFDDVRRPIQHGVADVSAASSHSCIVGMEGRVACVGGNSLGGLGTDPDELESARDFVEVRIPGLD